MSPPRTRDRQTDWMVHRELAALIHAGWPECAHLGLLYQSYAPLMLRDGKLDKNEKDGAPGGDAWFERLQHMPEPHGYRAFLARWQASFAGPGYQLVQATTQSRLLVGHGNPSATDVGLTLHHTWGVPIIPGSAIKGLMAHYLAATLGTEHLEYGRMFGTPALNDRQRGSRGELTVYDALWHPSREHGTIPVTADVLTPHHGDYYNGKCEPNDWTDPVPVSFLTVRPGTDFLFALHCQDTDLLQQAEKALREALADWGIGGKTSSGYGRMGETRTRTVPATRAEAGLLRDLRTFLEDRKQRQAPQRETLELIKQDWLPKLQALDSQAYGDLRKLVQEYIKSPKVSGERDRLLERITGPHR